MTDSDRISEYEKRCRMMSARKILAWTRFAEDIGRRNGVPVDVNGDGVEREDVTAAEIFPKNLKLREASAKGLGSPRAEVVISHGDRYINTHLEFF